MARKKLGTGVMFADVILYNFDSLLFFRTFVYGFYRRLSHNIEARKRSCSCFKMIFLLLNFFECLVIFSTQFCNTNISICKEQFKILRFIKNVNKISLLLSLLKLGYKPH